MKKIMLCVGATFALAGCSGGEGQRVAMVRCSGFIGGIGDSSISDQVLAEVGSKHGDAFSWIAQIGQTGGLYYQQLEPAKATSTVQEGREEASKLAERGDVRGAVAFLERCDRTRSSLAK